MARPPRIFLTWFCVADLPVTVWAVPWCLVILGTIDIGRIVESAILLPDRPPAFLVLKVPVEAGEGAVLLALVLQKQWALIHAKLF